MIILGLHVEMHNSGASVVWEDSNELQVVAISQERLDRVKNSSAYPDLAIKYCLTAAGISSVAECDHAVCDYFYRPRWMRDRYRLSFREMLSFLKKKLMTDNALLPGRVSFVDHHMAHACSTFYPSGFDRAAVLVVDGHGTMISPNNYIQRSHGGSPHDVFETQSFYTADSSSLKLCERSCKTGLGMLYAAFTRFLGFGELQEGKTMGLALYGEAQSPQHIRFPSPFSGMASDYSSIVNIWAQPPSAQVLDDGLIPARPRRIRRMPTIRGLPGRSRMSWKAKCSGLRNTSKRRPA